MASGEVARHAEEMQRQKAQLEQLTLAALSALVRATEAKSPHLRGHSERVANLSEKMARRLGLGPEAVKEVRVAGLLHDIGMAQIQESIVNKPGPPFRPASSPMEALETVRAGEGMW